MGSGLDSVGENRILLEPVSMTEISPKAAPSIRIAPESRGLYFRKSSIYKWNCISFVDTLEGKFSDIHLQRYLQLNDYRVGEKGYLRGL
jgi:hypothetical protein